MTNYRSHEWSISLCGRARCQKLTLLGLQHSICNNIILLCAKFGAKHTKHIDQIMEKTSLTGAVHRLLLEKWEIVYHN